jgi:hypothetical protein
MLVLNIPASITECCVVTAISTPEENVLRPIESQTTSQEQSGQQANFGIPHAVSKHDEQARSWLR